jgi:2-polyprenyl-6-methoxyphenol hydroxylase-like FAD-dependent oxidoreductase
MDTRGEHAVVLGASMGGLLAGRVLADFYDRVTVVERDIVPTDPVNRRGVPRGRPIRAVLARCTQIQPQWLTRRFGCCVPRFCFVSCAPPRPAM